MFPIVFIGFATDGRIHKVDPAAGPPSVVTETTLEGLPSWSTDGTILFARSREGIYRVPASGGTARPLTRVEPARGEVSHLWPHVLPDGRHFLYVSISSAPDQRTLIRSIQVASVDGGERRLLLTADSRVEYASPGYLLYVRDGTLLAQAFDARTLQLAGDAVPVADGLHYFMSAANAGFSVSQAGVLAYHHGAPTSRLVWFDRNGSEIGTVGNPAVHGSLRIAPDERHVAAEIVDPRSGTSDLWIYDVPHDTSTRLTSDLGSEADPVWSPDGHRIVFRSDRDGPPDLHQINASGVGMPDVLLKLAGVQRPTDWSTDGALLTYMEEDRTTGHSLWMLPLTGQQQPRPYLRTRFEEGGGAFSPDGRWLAFVSDESGRPKVYVAPVSEGTGKHRVSINGGFAPRWRHDGKELFYFEPGNRLMAAPVAAGPRLGVGAPVQLFRIASEVGFSRRIWYTTYDVSRRGQRFLVNVADTNPSPIDVILNWMSALDTNEQR
jgi:Tol biopolymer transport system component